MTAQSGTGGGLTEQVRERAGDTLTEARSKGREAVESQVDTRSTQAGERLGEVADQAHQVSSTLRDQGNDSVARLVDSAAQYTERAAGYLRDSSATTILDDLENLARRQPWAVAAGGLVLGFAAARVLRASRSGGHGEFAGSGVRDHSRDLDDLGTPYDTLDDRTATVPTVPAAGLTPPATPVDVPGTTTEGYGRGGL
jgi:vacuolar-type H+-ATPase subunit H